MSKILLAEGGDYWRKGGEERGEKRREGEGIGGDRRAVERESSV